MAEKNSSTSRRRSKRVENPVTDAPSDTELAPQVPAKSPSFVVGVGASAGGLSALETLFKEIPPDTGLAFVIVQHLSPDFKSMMADLLGRHTHMPVVVAGDGVEVERDTVYLIPPSFNLKIFHGRLFVEERDLSKQVPNLPIDIFFRSLAQDQEERSVGIILSGTGTDGTQGVRAIKEAGGLVMVQSPDSAQFDGMPRSAINTGISDFTAAPPELAELLVRYTRYPMAVRGDSAADSSIASDGQSLQKVLSTVRDLTGVDFSYYKPSTVLRRIERRMRVTQIERMSGYAQLLSKYPNEAHQLYRELLIGVTRFFRDAPAFQALRDRVIPEICKRASSASSPPIRVWVAGCSTGEEVYSIALCLADFLETTKKTCDFKIFATDIDPHAIEVASAGKYPLSVLADIPTALVSRYFTRMDDVLMVVERIRKRVVFARHNLLRDPPFNKLDLVVCRNLLIYLEPHVQRKILGMFGFSLNQGGHLFLGSSESVGDLQSIYHCVDPKWKLFEYKGGATSAEYQPVDIMQRLHLRGPVSGKRGTEVAPESVFERIRDDLIQAHIPPTLVLDKNLNILHVVGDASSLLQMSSGTPSFNLFKLAPRSLAMVVSNAVHQSNKTEQAIVYNNIAFSRSGQQEVLSLSVTPHKSQTAGGEFYVVSFFFRSASEQREDVDRKFDIDEATREHLKEVEQELQATRENLQATIEELETSNEELQATNEELMSSNEELQSTNEELQSVNEELYTVNAEYQNKIEELIALNNDVNNLLANTDIAIVFLDRQLRIRRFTPAAAALFPILEQDIGRPIAHFAGGIEDREFLNDMQEVLDTGRQRIRELVFDRAGSYQLRALPFKTSQQTIEGVVITLLDLTERLRADDQAHRLNALLTDSNDAVMVVDLFGNILVWNRRAEEMYGWTEREAVKMNLRMIVPEAGRSESVAMMEDSVKGTKLPSFKTKRLTKDGKELSVWVTVTALVDSAGNPRQIVLTERDISALADETSGSLRAC